MLSEFNSFQNDLNEHLMSSGPSSLTSDVFISNQLREGLATSNENFKALKGATNFNDLCPSVPSERTMKLSKDLKSVVSSDVSRPSDSSFDYFDPWRPDTNFYKNGQNQISEQNSVISFLKKTELSLKDEVLGGNENLLIGQERHVLDEVYQSSSIQNMRNIKALNSDSQISFIPQNSVNLFKSKTDIFNCNETSIPKFLKRNEEKIHLKSSTHLSEKSLSSPSLTKRIQTFEKSELPETPRRRIFSYPGGCVPLDNMPNNFNFNKGLVFPPAPNNAHLNEKKCEPLSSERSTYPNNEINREVQHVTPLFYVSQNVPLPTNEIVYDSINCQQTTNLNFKTINQNVCTPTSCIVPYTWPPSPFKKESRTIIEHYKTNKSINSSEQNMEQLNKNIINSFCIRNLSTDLYFHFQDISDAPFSYVETPVMYYVPPKVVDTSTVDWSSIMNKFESLIISDSPRIVTQDEFKNDIPNTKIKRKKRESISNHKSMIKNSNYGCKFCMSNCERREMYISHQLKQRLGNRTVISCPVLRRLVCERCGSTGDNAHTRSYCPVEIAERGQKPMSVANEIKKTKRFASGKIRRNCH